MKSEKGIVFQGIIKYINTNFDRDALSRVIKDMPKEDQTIMKSSKFDPMKNYPGTAMINLMLSADRILGQGDLKICYQLGRFVANETFRGIFLTLLQAGKPKSVIKRGPLAWKLIADTGALVVAELKDNFARIDITDLKDNKATCRYRIGFFEKVLELTNVKNVKVLETKCVHQGDSYCEYETSWE